MKLIRRSIIVGMMGLLGSVALASEETVTAQHRHVISGGIGEEEREGLVGETDTHNVWLITARRLSGEYLADGHVRIFSRDGKSVLDTDMAGPWLFVDLNDGYYKVEISAEGQTLSRDIKVKYEPKRRKTSMYVFYFD